MIYLLPHLLERSTARHPGRVAVVAPGAQLTYGELAARAHQVAGALARAGVGPGAPVALIMDKSIDALVALHGVLASGGACVPIDPMAPPARAARMVENGRVRHVIASQARAADLVAPMLARGCDAITHVLVPDAPGDALARALPGRAVTSWRGHGSAPRGAGARLPIDMDLAYILHTSGSTGAPRGVAITHRNALAFVTMCVGFFAVTADDVLASHAPLHFDLSIFDLFVAAAAGAAVALVPPHLSAFPKHLADAVDEHGITIWSSVASALTLMSERGQLERCRLDSLRTVIFSGEVLPVRALRALRRRMPGAVFYNVYGQTEANSSMYHRVDQVPDDDGARLPIGRPFPNAEVFALDDQGRVIDAPGAVGELHVRSASVAAGYVGDAARTAEVFLPDPRDPITGGRVYRTGDLVTRDADGSYVFVGRADSQIKRRGYRIELGEIELALLACPGVEAAAALALPDAAAGARVVAVVSPRPGAALDRALVLAACRERLPSYMVPEAVVVREALPRTSTGKIDRGSIRDELLARTTTAA